MSDTHIDGTGAGDARVRDGMLRIPPLKLDADGLVAAVIQALDPAHPTLHPDPEQTVKDQT